MPTRKIEVDYAQFGVFIDTDATDDDAVDKLAEALISIEGAEVERDDTRRNEVTGVYSTSFTIYVQSGYSCDDLMRQCREAGAQLT